MSDASKHRPKGAHVVPKVRRRTHGDPRSFSDPEPVPCPICYAPVKGARCTGHGAHPFAADSATKEAR